MGFEFQPLVTQARTQSQLADAHCIFDVGRRGECLLAGDRSRGILYTDAKTARAIGSVVGLDVGAVLLVVVKPQANREVMLDGSGCKLMVQLILPAIRLMIAKCIGRGDGSRTEAFEQIDATVGEHRFGDIGDARTRDTDRRKLVPIAPEGVEIHRAFKAKHIAGLSSPLQISAPLLGAEFIIERRGVTTIRVLLKVGIREAGVGFIGVEV